MPYLTEQGFHMMLFDHSQVLEDINISQLLGIQEERIRPIDAVPDPFINCVFEQKNNLFITLFDPRSKILTYFSYNVFQGKLKWNPVQLHLAHKGVNYPIKTVYDSTRHLFFIFFRHGQSIIINPLYPEIAKQ